jgi:phytoene dehydrogenase-like protein
MSTSTYLDQLYSTRPVVGHADYRMPIPGLMCGASTYPGGGVTGAPGHNAVHEMIHAPDDGSRASSELS